MTVTRSTSRGERLRDGRVEAADRLRAAEDEQHALALADREALPRRLAVDRARVPDRGAGDEAGHARGGAAECLAGGRERHREHVGEARRRADGPAGDDVAVPQHDRDAQRGGRQQDRDRDVAAGREDRGRPPAARSAPACGTETPRRIGSRTAWTSSVAVRSERRREAAQRDRGRRHDRGLEAAVAAEPAELRRVRTRAE